MRMVCYSLTLRNTSQVPDADQHPCAPCFVGGITLVLRAACAARRQDRRANAATLTTTFQHVAGVGRALTKVGPILAIHVVICARLRCRGWHRTGATGLRAIDPHEIGESVALTIISQIFTVPNIICATWLRLLCWRICRCLSWRIRRRLSWCICRRLSRCRSRGWASAATRATTCQHEAGV